MNPSMREIARRMDPLDPPTSLIDLNKRHRWLSGNQSLRRIVTRHTNFKTFRFLSYNTYLLRAEIPLGLFVDEVLGFDNVMKVLNVGALDVLKKDGVSVKTVVDLFGISAAAILGSSAAVAALLLVDPSGISLAAAVTSALANLTLEDALSKFGIAPMDVIEKILKPSDIMRLFGIDVSVTVKNMPAIDSRAFEIGQMLANPANDPVLLGLPYDLQPYDLMALCEVWQDDLRDRILQAWQNKPLISEGAKLLPTDSPSKVVMGSGLLVLSRDSPIVERKQLVFTNQGNPLIDADAWSKKGVLFSRVDVGYGYLDIFSTHLYSGGGLLNLPAFGLGAPTDDESVQVQEPQLNELSQFFWAQHDPSNVAVVTGDFNIDGRNPSLYQHICSFMNNRMNGALKDVWRTQWGDVDLSGASGYMGKRNSGAYTNTSHKDDVGFEISDRMANYVGKSAPQSDQFCREPSHNNDDPSDPRSYDIDDLSDPYKEEERVDYIFVESPTTTHTFNLDVTRIRRRSFKRVVPTEGMDYLSDHLGLDVTFIVSPR